MANDRECRQMLVRLVESYNYDLLAVIADHYGIPRERLMARYHTPYYYMPIIEQTFPSHVVASGVHE